MKRFLFIAGMAACLSACHSNNDYDKLFKDPNLYCATVHQLNTVVMGNNFSPIVASRNYLYASIAGYEVMAAGNPDRFVSLAGQLRGLQRYPNRSPGSPPISSWHPSWPFANWERPLLFPKAACRPMSTA
jgi:hypothetical protein